MFFLKKKEDKFYFLPKSVGEFPQKQSAKSSSCFREFTASFYFLSSKKIGAKGFSKRQ
jgi:hypothetical protein